MCTQLVAQLETQVENFRHSLVIAAAPHAAFIALSSITGLRAWWTEDCHGDPLPGGAIRVRFGGVEKTMRVGTVVKDRQVGWVCTSAFMDVPSLRRKDEWVGTQMIFGLSAGGAGTTRLDFEHIGLTPGLECYDMCAGGWRHFLDSLRQYLETGTGMPYRTAVQLSEGATA
ncbi:SRPBCC domain-containing protein [Pseudoduganella plicata]|uniref:SRPBCC domain-containing protein n=1 Tax=Pseudoduganella plicata TaxID=321984 RepID=A0A4P7BC63_9BURK|nr:SRPBCC domain-containing protein [Pseudoduganella plicata]QBQ35750.1 SRPBCC domain-containing protein [Pseudoduganella plicata]GGY95392.1 hypothetical protein GCM10007388_30940 [Pseudoduganella plicata]